MCVCALGSGVLEGVGLNELLAEGFGDLLTSELTLGGFFHLDHASVHAVKVAFDRVQALGGGSQGFAGLLSHFAVLLDFVVTLFDGGFDLGLNGVQVGFDCFEFHDGLSDVQGQFAQG